MPRRLPSGCIEDPDRHGNPRVYYRPNKKVPKVRLRGTPWTPAFMAEYDAARSSISTPKVAGLAENTWRWLCVRYFAECGEYRRLDARFQRVRRQVLEATFDEPIAPGSPKKFADYPLSLLTPDAIEVLRDRKLDTPDAANNRLKSIRQVFKWGSKKRWPNGKPYVVNHAREVAYLKTGSMGHHTWTLEEVRQYEDRHPIGTQARLALALLMFTGQRRSDVARLGKQHVRNGAHHLTQFKGRNHKAMNLILPILPALKEVIEATKGCGDLTYLVSKNGTGYKDGTLGNKFREWCDQANLRHCSAHGVRKAGATIAAMKGATTKQLMAVFGWTTSKQADWYTQAADQFTLANSAMHLLDNRERIETKVGLTPGSGETFSPKDSIKTTG